MKNQEKLNPENINKYLIVIAGPTASGKTDLAVRLARRFHSEIISADSRQFYKEIPIGTAAPSEKLLHEIKHHFVGHLSVSDEYNVARYEQDAIKLLKTLFRQHEVVFLVGGSGLYIDAVCKGIDEFPDLDVEIRLRVKKAFEKFGLRYLQDELQKHDPEYFSVADTNNPVRIMRALEVFYQTGKKYSELRLNVRKERDFQTIKIAIDIPRNVLNDRISDRAALMIDTGWVDEAKSVLKYKKLIPLNTIGYKELFNYLEGKRELAFTLGKIIINTRRYAKRQMTWFRKDKEYTWFSPEKEEEIVQFIKSKISCKKLSFLQL